MESQILRMELARIIISETNEEQVIVLREVDGERAFPIVIGIWEAVAIDRNIKQKTSPRPMTHDLLQGVIDGLQATLEKVVISELRERTFYAKLVLRRSGEIVEVDSRPSDAIALAVQMKAPIFVHEQVLQELTQPQSEDFGGFELDPDLPGDDEPEEI